MNLLQTWAVICACAGVAALASLLIGRRCVRGTTLAAVWIWQCLAVVLLCGASVWLLTGSADRLERLQPVQFVVAVFLFCPHMALLGAKRPQDRAWSLIVAALWGILALPALEVVVLHPGQAITIRDLRGAFLWGLVLIEIANRAGTRAWPVGLLFAAAQFVLLAEHLPLVRQRFPAIAWPIACVCWAAAASWWIYQLARPAGGATTFDCWWRDFRDQFGVLWSLRVAERINAVAVANQWPRRLHWRGFESVDAPSGAVAESEGALRQSMVNLLRRFVSEKWLQVRES